MDKFREIRDSYIKEKLSDGRRYVTLPNLKYHMKKMGYSKVCMWCGKPLSGRRTSWCCDEHGDEFYKRYLWQYTRSEYLWKNPLCERCGAKATEVHHKVPIKQYLDIGVQGELGDENNLMAVCHDCHKLEHRELRKLYAPEIAESKMMNHTLDEYGFEDLPDKYALGRKPNR